MASLEDLGSLKRNPSGQKVCHLCTRSYNNKHIPEFCLEAGCDAYLGGTYKPKKKEDEAFMLTQSVCSVRLNTAGVPKRVFVDLPGEKCSNDQCMQAKGSLNMDQRSKNFCQHIKKAREASSAKIFAKVENISLQRVLSNISDEELEEAIKKESSDEEIMVFLLPGEIIAVPLFNSETSGSENLDFVHVKGMKCTLESCTKSKKRKHTLVAKEPSLCLHSFLCRLLDSQPADPVKKDSKHYIDYRQTIRNVLSKVKKNFPQSYKECEESDFLRNSRTFVDSLIHLPEKLEAVLKVVPSICEKCHSSLIEWNYKKPRSYFLSIGHLREITIPVRKCPQCKIAYYPDYTPNGILFIHNKFMLSLELVLELSHVLQLGGSFIEAIKKKFLLLGQVEGLEAETLERDLTSNSIKLEKTVIAVVSMLVKGVDMDQAVCYLCGICPKIVSTDGNTKDSIRVRKNMSYDYDDESEVPDLMTFKEELIEEVLMSVFFQYKSSRTWNMLKIPTISPPSTLRKQVNSEKLKKTLLEKQFSYTESTFETFKDLVDKKDLKINTIGNMKNEEVQYFGKLLGIETDKSVKKSIELLKTDLTNLAGMLLGGQGVCHKYIYERGRTGGWQDMHCSHLFKVSSKMQACQESVSDPSDLVHCLWKIPVVLVCDDPCTFVSHSMLRYPVLAELAYGELKGCFQKPSDSVLPDTNISCPDITPVEYQDTEIINRQAMLNGSQLIHPDVSTSRRYVSGTRLQMREGGTSHKKNSCRFHDLSKTKEGAMIKSMNQEAMQVVRKSKTIQQDKMRSFQISYLANMLQDFFHNLSKHKEQVARYKKIDGFKSINRDELTKRACIILDDDANSAGPPTKKHKN